MTPTIRTIDYTRRDRFADYGKGGNYFERQIAAGRTYLEDEAQDATSI